MIRAYSVVVCFLMSASSMAVEYDCAVEKKIDPDRSYSQDVIKKYKYSVKIEEKSDGSFLSRCSFAPSANKVICDRYEVDQVVFDENVKIKKYYVFLSQFDVQLFSDISFLENNGRGGIAYGKCKVVAP